MEESIYDSWQKVEKEITDKLISLLEDYITENYRISTRYDRKKFALDYLDDYFLVELPRIFSQNFIENAFTHAAENLGVPFIYHEDSPHYRLSGNIFKLKRSK